MDQTQILVLHLLQRRIQDEFGHPQNGVQRRPDLVAHVGQKVALGAIGRLRRVFRERQFPIRLFQRLRVSFQVRGHLVETTFQITQFVVSLNENRTLQLSLRDGHGPLGKASNPLGQ